MDRKLIIAALARAVVRTESLVIEGHSHYATCQGVTAGVLALGLDATPTEVEDAVRAAREASKRGAL